MRLALLQPSILSAYRSAPFPHLVRITNIAHRHLLAPSQGTRRRRSPKPSKLPVDKHSTLISAPQLQKLTSWHPGRNQAHLNSILHASSSACLMHPTSCAPSHAMAVSKTNGHGVDMGCAGRLTWGQHELLYKAPMEHLKLEVEKALARRTWPGHSHLGVKFLGSHQLCLGASSSGCATTLRNEAGFSGVGMLPPSWGIQLHGGQAASVTRLWPAKKPKIPGR